MGTFNGNKNGGRFAATKAKSKARSTGAGTQFFLSALLLLSLLMVYTVIMQMTHQQKAFEASTAVNLSLLAIFSLAAIGLLWAIIRTKAWKRALCLFLTCTILYLIVAFSNIPLVKKYRERWISTAWSTMRHQGLATFFFPDSVVKEVIEREQAGRDAQIGKNTGKLDAAESERQNWVENMSGESSSNELDEELLNLPPDQRHFYVLFYELDRTSMEEWLRDHPEAAANGYDHIMINESCLYENGTTIRTKLGEKVLAIDTENQVLLLEVDCDGSRGVLAVAKDNSRLHLLPAAHVGSYGETVGSIAQRNNGVLAMTGSGFIDDGGVGNGGQIAGWAMCDGTTYGAHYGYGYKRIELHEDNWFYIQDAPAPVGEGTTDAMEFTPALLTDGKRLDPGIWTSQNPRACIGQSKRGEILMLCVEGRSLSSPGCSVEVCANVLLQHDGLTALNCDGGTTAIMWFRGEPVMRCSNTAIPQGRYLPNAWVYVKR